MTDQATGFNWEDGRWVRTQFKGGTYVVSKVESPNDPVEALRSGKLACGKLAAEETTFRTFNEFADGDHKMYGTCLRLHRVGHKNPEFMKCTELHSKKTGTWVVTFACGEANFYFEPNGQFHLGTVHGFVESKPKDDYKDSLVISVGNCAGMGEEVPESH